MKDLARWLAWRVGALVALLLVYVIVVRPLLWGIFGELGTAFGDAAAPILVMFVVWLYHQIRPADIVTLRLTGVVVFLFCVTRIYFAFQGFQFGDFSLEHPTVLFTIAGGFIGAAMGGHAAMRPGINVVGLNRDESGWRRSKRDSHGSGDLASEEHVRGLLDCRDGLPLGEWGDDRWLMRWDKVGNIMTVAPPGEGKLVSSVMPACIEYPGSIVCTDPRGENYAVGGLARRLLGRKVVLLNPLDVPAAEGICGGFNPLDYLREGDTFSEDCMKIADALVVFQPGDKAHFVENAKIVIAGVIAYIWTVRRGRKRNLNAVYSHFITTIEVFDQWALSMVELPDFAGGVPQLAGLAWSRVGGEERGSFFSTLGRQFYFLTSPGIKRCLTRSTFSLEEIVDGTTDLFVCLPARVDATFLRFYRLAVGLALAEVMRRRTPPDREVLFLLDEAALLGRLDSVLSAFGSGAYTAGRGNGVKIWTIWQQPSQPAAIYGKEGADVLLGTTAVLQVFGVGRGDKTAGKDYAELIGAATAVQQGESTGTGESGGSGRGGGSLNVGKSEHDIKRDVLTADEIRRLGRDEQLLFMRDVEFPVKCKRVKYFNRPEWWFRYGWNPYVPKATPQIGCVKSLLVPQRGPRTASAPAPVAVTP